MSSTSQHPFLISSPHTNIFLQPLATDDANVLLHRAFAPPTTLVCEELPWGNAAQAPSTFSLPAGLFSDVILAVNHSQTTVWIRPAPSPDSLFPYAALALVTSPNWLYIYLFVCYYWSPRGKEAPRRRDFAFTESAVKALSLPITHRNQPGKQEMLNKYLLSKFINKLMASLVSV